MIAVLILCGLAYLILTEPHDTGTHHHGGHT